MIRGTDARTVTDIPTGKQLFGGLSAANPPLVGIDLLPALPVDQLEIAAIDENTGTLSQDKYRITPVYGITE